MTFCQGLRNLPIEEEKFRARDPELDKFWNLMLY
jgi:hypothetical protein